MRRRGLSQLEAGGEPWDITGARETNKLFTASPLGAAPNDIFFKSDGTQMYVAGSSGNSTTIGAPIVVFNLSTAWNISTATYSYTAELSGASSTVNNIYISDDGLHLFIDINITQYQYSLSTAWDLASASFIRSRTHRDLSNTLLFDGRSFFKNDGTKMFVMGYNSGSSHKIIEYTLSTAWNISTVSAVREYTTIGTLDDDPNGLFFKSDGTKMYVLGYETDRIMEFSLGTAWSLSSVSGPNSYYTGTSLSQGLYFKPNGLDLYFIDFSTDLVYQYSMTSAWNTSTASQTRTFDPYTREADDSVSIDFKSDGSKLYVLAPFATIKPGEDIWYYDLTSNWSLQNATFNSGAELDKVMTSIFFKPDGTKLFVLEDYFINEYTMSPAWDLTTLSYVGNKIIISQESSAKSLFFKSDGTKAYVVGTSGDDVNQYSLTTAWDISTLTFINSFSVSSQESAPYAIAFKTDGTKFYIAGDAEIVYEYTMSTAWDTNSASYTASKDLSGTLGIRIESLRFSTGGDKMFILDAYNDVYEYTLAVL